MYSKDHFVVLAKRGNIFVLWLRNYQTAFCHILVSIFVSTLPSLAVCAFDGSLPLISFSTVTFRNWALAVVLRTSTVQWVTNIAHSRILF